MDSCSRCSTAINSKSERIRWATLVRADGLNIFSTPIYMMVDTCSFHASFAEVVDHEWVICRDTPGVHKKKKTR